MKKETLPKIKNTSKKKSLKAGHAVFKSEFTITSKLRLKDYIVWDKKARSIQYLIINHPVELWNKIHNRKRDDKKLSLVRPAYAKLKNEVNKIDSTLVDKVNKQHDNYNSMRKLRKEMSNGIFGSENSRFKKITSS